MGVGIPGWGSRNDEDLEHQTLAYLEKAYHMDRKVILN